MRNSYIEIILTVYLKKDINYLDSFSIISRGINSAVFLDEDLRKKHEVNVFKYYVYNSFFPTVQDKIYKSGDIYIFKIRTIDEMFGNKIGNLIKSIDYEYFKVIATEKRIIKKHFITMLETITPAVVTTEKNKNWVKGDSIELLMKRLDSNLEKKCKRYYKVDMVSNENFIERIEMVNEVPISIPYKNTKIIGNKFRIFPKEDDISQAKTFMAEACGIAEKSSSLGAGFCYAKYL